MYLNIFKPKQKIRLFRLNTRLKSIHNILIVYLTGQGLNTQIKPAKFIKPPNTKGVKIT